MLARRIGGGPAVETRKLGRTGLRVPVLCLGTMTFGLQCDRDTSFAILDRALEGGLDFLDTADVYPLGGGLDTVGRTEEILGEWMRERGVRERIVLATKCCGPMGKGPNDAGLSRQHIVAAVEASLRRLRTDWIDLYQSHAFDARDADRRDAARLRRSRARGQGPLRGLLELPGVAARRRAARGRPARRRGLRLGAAPLQPALSRDRDGAAAALPRRGARRARLQPARGRLPLGQAQGAAREPEAGTRFALGTAAGIYRHRYWQEAQFRVVERLAKECEARGARARLGGGGVGARAGGRDLGHHRREPARAARGLARRRRAEARPRAGEALRRALVGAAAAAGIEGYR